MHVARLVKPGQPFEVGTADQPTPGLKDVLVRVAACGIVPNSKNVSNGGMIAQGMPLPTLPAIFGLDVAGTIEAVGEHVLNLKVGDRVYVNPHLTCDTCHQCRKGRRDLCPQGVLRGYFANTPQGQGRLDQYPIGGLSQFLLSPDSKIALLPESIDFPTGARLGYIGTSYAALKKGELGAGKTVLINGVTGTLGVAAVAIALGMGAVKILGIGRNKERLAEVMRLSNVAGRVATRSSEDEWDLIEWVKEQTGGWGVDVMYDCLGVGGDADTTSRLIKEGTKMGGKAILAAGGAEGTLAQSYAEFMTGDRVSPFPSSLSLSSKLTPLSSFLAQQAIQGSNWFSDGEMDELVALIGSGVVDFSFLQTKPFPLDQVNEALAFAGDRPGGFVNVVVQPHA